MTMAPELSLRDRPFIVWWGRRSDAPAGAPTVMLSPFPYAYDLPYQPVDDVVVVIMSARR